MTKDPQHEDWPALEEQKRLTELYEDAYKKVLYLVEKHRGIHEGFTTLLLFSSTSELVEEIKKLNTSTNKLNTLTKWLLAATVILLIAAVIQIYGASQLQHVIQQGYDLFKSLIVHG